jgi:two-component system, NtrC family, response regulator AlgB
VKAHRKRSEALALRNPDEDSFFLQSHNRAMQRLLESAKRAAGTDGTILLVGESGTGKSLLAKQIHLWSPRRAKPFWTVECATLRQQSQEKEGSFSGLLLTAKGGPARLEGAEAGTLFLASVDDLPASLQVELARFVQDRTIESADGQRPIDVRIIAGTSCDLFAGVRAHRFREDLYYGLNIISLHVPPLRERSADILPLAVHMLAAAATRNRRGALQLSKEAAAAMVHYRWPGNVRELRNAMEAAAVLCPGEIITLANLPQAISTPPPSIDTSLSSKPSLDKLELEHISRVLRESGTLEQAAATLGINVTTLWRKRKRYNLDQNSGSKSRKLFT